MKRMIKAWGKVCRGEKGFTLIELLVVIGILAVLAGVVTLAVTQFIGRGNAEAYRTEGHNIQTAVAAYMVDHSGVPPTSLDDLQVPGSRYLLTVPRWSTWVWDGEGAVTIDATPPVLP